MTLARIGIVGTGFIATHLALSADKNPDYSVARVLTRRDPNTVTGFPEGVVTNSPGTLVSSVDVIIECSGDPLWATEVIVEAIGAGIPVVTVDTEFHITTGSALVGRGLITEAEGDQPGSLAALHEEAVAMGFRPVAYGNMKGFLNPDPSVEDMEYWGAKQGISLPMVTSFTDGTKVQAEQILVGNHFGATIAGEGMLSPAVDDLQEGTDRLVEGYEAAGRPITDYIVGQGLPHGIFIVATHDVRQAPALAYYKMGDGPYYTLIKPSVLVHLEVFKTVQRVLEAGTVLLDNSNDPELSLAAKAKRSLRPGERIEAGIGSFDLRGHAIRIEDHPDHVPIGLIRNATVARPIERDQLIRENDLELPESLAARLWREIVPRT